MENSLFPVLLFFVVVVVVGGGGGGGGGVVTRIEYAIYQHACLFFFSEDPPENHI